MSGLGELSSQVLVVHDDPATDRAATLNTVWRCHQLGLEPEETAGILAALGLVSHESGGRYDPNGRRYRNKLSDRPCGSDPGALPANAASPRERAHSPSNRHPGVDGGAA